MTTASFRKALTATGYLMPNGNPAPGLARTGEDATWRLRSVLTDSRVGLKADAVFSAQNTPTIIFKDAGNADPDEAHIHQWHEAAWNVGLAPLLWIITPTEIRLYDCYASRTSSTGEQSDSIPLEVFPLDVSERLQALDSLCGRFATETGAFWSSSIGQKINRRHRVDRELLSEISALEESLTLVPRLSPDQLQQPETEMALAREFAQRLIGRCIFTLYLVDRGIARPFLPRP